MIVTGSGGWSALAGSAFVASPLCVGLTSLSLIIGILRARQGSCGIIILVLPLLMLLPTLVQMLLRLVELGGVQGSLRILTSK